MPKYAALFTSKGEAITRATQRTERPGSGNA